ncbi:MAG: hypothetical protein KAI29_12855, partial [Cyclobacteriaceae bacterium]|nr:hypothetical protein [Cyclobacteriaceae bacterium]
KVTFTGSGSSLQNINAHIFYDSILFQGTGNMYGNCTVNDLEFLGQGSVYDSDTIHYARFLTQDTIFNNIIGSHQIENLEILLRGKIDVQNDIHTATIGEQAKIIDQNQIDYIRIGDTAYIEGSNVFGYLFLNRMGYIRENNFAQKAIFNCDGSFVGDNAFDTLSFTPGFEYIFEYGTNQTINNKWYLDGTCEAPIFIKSSYNGIEAGILATNAIISGTHLSLRDMQASGNTPFIASQSVNLGNNTNWNIETMTVRDLYWVNGQGNWDNSNHWDINSGGPGGHCPPTELDNTFFDGGSAGTSDTIFINTRNAVCFNMDWTGVNNPVLFGPDTNNLKIYGSLKFDPAMD